MLSDVAKDSSDVNMEHNSEVIPSITLFGHNARIWDCSISDSVIITAGEDCSCRVWGMDGKQVMMFKEHSGRGIWRCLYHSGLSLVVTAGFDSAIKIHHVAVFPLKQHEINKSTSNESNSVEKFTISPPTAPRSKGPMDSKSEYVRCLQFTQENSLYVATNNGFLYHTDVSNSKAVNWNELIQVHEKAAIVCMDVFSVGLPFYPRRSDVVALGDGKGYVTIVSFGGADNPGPIVDFLTTWPAEKERQLLGVHWCMSLGCSYLLTANPRGILKLWNIEECLASNSPHRGKVTEASLVAVFESSFGARIMCLDVSSKHEILIAGDNRGNIVVFAFPENLIGNACRGIQEMPLRDRFKGAHGISSVTNIHIVGSESGFVETRTTGGDGCICTFKYAEDVHKLEFVGMKQVKELGTIQVVLGRFSNDELELDSYAIGFTSSDFIIWDLINESRMVQISCGGWRRPHSYYLGHVPEYQNCFAYLKDNDIHVHRVWALPQVDFSPKVFHMQFHGREIHSSCFINLNSQPGVKRGTLWITTGCEDGTVRMTRYSPMNGGRWFASKLLGEHVGGSAVRSLCFVSKIYELRNENSFLYPYLLDPLTHDDAHLLLISVGSKRVLTSWVLLNKTPGQRNEGSSEHATCVYSDQQNSSLSFQWLSTDMPRKLPHNCQTVHKSFRGDLEDYGSEMLKEFSYYKSDNVNSTLSDQMKNDWRYMAVTSFLLKHSNNKLTVCFIVVACSDATLVLRALILPVRLWYDVAVLVPQRSPVLALQHLVVSESAPIGDGNLKEARYIAISGGTDGSITFWDLTEAVENFMQQVSKVQPEKHIDCQRRPRTGRGSQGGRRWRSLNIPIPENDNQNALSETQINGCAGVIGTNGIPSKDSNMHADDAATTQRCFSDRISVTDCDPGSRTDWSSSEVPEVRPICILNGVHQSGVNCLHVSKKQISESGPFYCILSGGDDQGVHCLLFTFEEQRTEQAIPVFINDIHLKNFSSVYSPNLKIFSSDRVQSAHSSAVKGIWTNGSWGFSTGLDQRVRCWQINQSGKLNEFAHLVISVPEPETLDVTVWDRNSYEIAVAGRGMQMIRFTPEE